MPVHCIENNRLAVVFIIPQTEAKVNHIFIQKDITTNFNICILLFGRIYVNMLVAAKQKRRSRC